MVVGVDPELLEFCTPWLAREPRLLVACQFAPEGRARERFLASCIVVRELAEAAMAVSDRRVAEAKLAWWVEEASAWSRGQARHPLARGFEAADSAPALATLALAATHWLEAPPAVDAAAVQRQLEPLAAAIAALAGGAAPAAWSLPWLALALRLSLHTQASLASVLPLDLMARHGVRRSQWPQLGLAERTPVLVDLARCVPGGDVRPRDPALAALVELERRWLRRLARPDADRIGLLDTFAAWRAARAAAAQARAVATAARG